MDKSDNKRILLKIGSNVLTNETDKLSIDKIKDIAVQIASLTNIYDFIIVTSGAIAVAKEHVNIEDKDVKVKQALSAIGQPLLMNRYQEIFKEQNLLTAQCLLSYSDFENENSKINIGNTINLLIKNGYIPVINENDTVSTEELNFGDNDKLGALTAVLLDVDAFIIATNTNGIYTKESMKSGKGETINSSSNIQSLRDEIESTISLNGTGGMSTKVEASSIAKNANIDTWIVNGLKPNFILDAINNTSKFTKITKK